MGKDYNKSALTAQRLIIKFGASAKLIKNEGILIDSLKPYLGKHSSQDICYTTTCALLPISANDKRLLLEGVSVETSQQCYMEAVELTVEPKIGDKIEQSGKTWRVVSIAPLNPAGTNVFWDMVVSR